MIYIGADDGIYRWVDKSHWPAFHSLQGHGIISLAAPGPGLLAAVDSTGRVWETTSNGLEWVEIPVPPHGARPVAVACANTPGTILLTTRPLGLFRRQVGGPIPAPTEPPGGPARLKHLVASSPVWPKTVGAFTMISNPHAQTAPTESPRAWNELAAPQVAQQGPAVLIRSLVSGLGPGAPWFAAVGGAGLWRSDDAGATWLSCPGLPAEIYAVRLAGPANDAVLVATSNGCWLSTDRGRTWEARSGGLEQAMHVHAIETHPEDAGSFLAGAAPVTPNQGTQFALYETSDGGKTWTHVKRGFPDVLEYDTITDIRYDPAAPENAIVALDSGELWRTRNGGDWWEPIARQMRGSRVLCAAR
jgi:hypothetical protein